MWEVFDQHRQILNLVNDFKLIDLKVVYCMIIQKNMLVELCNLDLFLQNINFKRTIKMDLMNFVVINVNDFVVKKVKHFN